MGAFSQVSGPDRVPMLPTSICCQTWKTLTCCTFPYRNESGFICKVISNGAFSSMLNTKLIVHV